MDYNPDYTFRLYNSVLDYSTENQPRLVKYDEFSDLKNVFIEGKRSGRILLERLQNKKSPGPSIFFSHYSYEKIKSQLAKEKYHFVFIDNFLNDSESAGKAIQTLESLVAEFPNLYFFIAVYQDIKSLSGKILTTGFKVAELLTNDEVIRQQSKPVEEIQQQKSEPITEIKQAKSNPINRPNRRSKREFKPTSTDYDELFRKIINSPELDELRNNDRFVLEQSRNTYRSFESLIKSAKLHGMDDLAIQIKSRFERSDIFVDQLQDTSIVWEMIRQVVRDLYDEIDFRENNGKRSGLAYQKSIELERNWALDLLKAFSSPGENFSLDGRLINYFEYFENPQGQPYIFDEDVKRKITERIFKKEYVRSQFAPLLWSYFESLTQNNPRNTENLGYFVAYVLVQPEIKAIWNTEEQVQSQTQSTPLPDTFNNSRVIGQYSPDEASEIDHLGFKNDVHALAALIAYEKTPLPLAIGLFGNWGSGKSSFMKQLEKRVDVLSTEQYNNTGLAKTPDAAMPYCTNITHITFNAWHYSDGNLWASMMVHIFDELLEKIAASKTREQLRAELLKNLSTASEAVVEAEKRVAESTSKLIAAKSTLAKIEEQRKDIDKELEGVQLSLKDVFGTLMKDAQFSSTIQHLAKESGYDKLIENKKQLEEWKSEMDSFGERLLKAYKNIFKANKIAAVLMVALPVILAVLFFYLYKEGTLKYINAAVVAAAASLVPFLGKMMGQVRKINTSLRRLESLQKEKVDKKELELKEREKFITEEIRQHEATVTEQQKEVEAAKKEEADAKAALDAIDINRQLTSFIRQRQEGNSYQQHLGIISLIRKDFGELRKFLKASNKEKKPKERIIERIVLYIDDLDRCKTDRVVAVLEAVHLLLAFDLFVVIVGVDPRWVSKALKEQYKEQLHLDAADDSDTARLPGHRATPFDYLEKIFQVPFVLRSMDNSGAKKLLDNLFKGQVKATEKVSEPVPDFGPLNDPQNTGNPIMKDPFDEKNLSKEQNEAMKRKAEEMEAEFKKQQEEKEKLQKEEAAQKEFIEQVENLTISEEELEFMKKITPIIGSTPRTLKRYGNLYRLLRVHSDLPNYSIDKLDVYQSVMLLLSISVSNGSIARPFFTALRESKKAGFYEMNQELIDELKKLITAARNKMEEKDEDEKEKEDALGEQLQALNQLHAELGKLPTEIKNFSVATLKKYSPVVSRFSFRTLNCIEEETVSAKA